MSAIVAEPRRNPGGTPAEPRWHACGTLAEPRGNAERLRLIGMSTELPAPGTIADHGPDSGIDHGPDSGTDYGPDRGIDHELDRRRTLRALARGEISRSRVCDASREVRASAEVLGAPADRSCPVCGTGLRETWWVHGTSIGEKSGTARSLAEIRQLLSALRTGEDLMVHTVEVCLRCGWNYLIREEAYRGLPQELCQNPGPPQTRPSTGRPAR